MTAFEKYGFRDEDISRRHREYGYDCPAVDLDFVLVEYSKGLPAALVEYKHWRAYGTIKINHSSYKALRALADASGIPFFITFYWPENWAYLVQPANHEAIRLLGRQRALSEVQWVSVLYYLRHVRMPERIHLRLGKGKPPVEYQEACLKTA